jgi:peptidoglycan/xylan/chitin deacetylase (PgdA/CDA1 family)
VKPSTRALHAVVSTLGLPLAAVTERVLRFSGRRVGLAVVYHSVGDPQGDPRRELVPALGTRLFAAQLRHLNDRYHLVSASELLEATTRRRRGQRFPATLTFDDDLRSHAEVALPILRELGLAAAFFVSGSSLDGPFTFWWERLQLAVDRGLALPEILQRSGPAEGRDDIHRLGRRIEAMAAEERDTVASDLAALVGPDPPEAGLRAADIQVLADAGNEIGFHTVRHDPLPTLDDQALRRAVRDGRSLLEEVIGQDVTVIAYPHGRTDERVAEAARAAGYTIGFSGAPEPVRPTSDPLLLGRFNPSYRSVGHLAVQLARALLRGAFSGTTRASRAPATTSRPVGRSASPYGGPD